MLESRIKSNTGISTETESSNPLPFTMPISVLVSSANTIATSLTTINHHSTNTPTSSNMTYMQRQPLRKLSSGSNGYYSGTDHSPTNTPLSPGCPNGSTDIHYEAHSQPQQARTTQSPEGQGQGYNIFDKSLATSGVPSQSSQFQIASLSANATPRSARSPIVIRSSDKTVYSLHSPNSTNATPNKNNDTAAASYEGSYNKGSNNYSNNFGNNSSRSPGPICSLYGGVKYFTPSEVHAPKIVFDVSIPPPPMLPTLGFNNHQCHNRLGSCCPWESNRSPANVDFVDTTTTSNPSNDVYFEMPSMEPFYSLLSCVKPFMNVRPSAFYNCYGAGDMEQNVAYQGSYHQGSDPDQGSIDAGESDALKMSPCLRSKDTPCAEELGNYATHVSQ